MSVETEALEYYRKLVSLQVDPIIRTAVRLK